MEKQRIAIFASGAGSNAMNLIRHFSGHPEIEIAFVLSNKADAGIVPAARAAGVPTLLCTNQEAADGDFLLSLCQKENVRWIILAGYLRLIPSGLIVAFPRRMINLHPSLLPRYGGKGMYGHHVHEAVAANGDDHTGITIHFVNAHFDEGEIIAQFHTPLPKDADIHVIEGKIRYLEQSYLPIVVEKTILA